MLAIFDCVSAHFQKSKKYKQINKKSPRYVFLKYFLNS